MISLTTVDTLALKHETHKDSEVFAGEYVDGNLAIFILDEYGRPDALSINVPEVFLMDGQFVVGDYSEHTGTADALEAAGVATKGISVPIGFGTGFVMTLNEDLAEKL